jgi:hypothetical protein
MEDTITSIFNIIMGIVFVLVKIVLLPIDLLIKNALPNLNDAFANVGEFITLIGSSLGWAISAAGIPYSVIALIGTYYIFKLTLPINIWVIKLAIKWFRVFKP